MIQHRKSRSAAIYLLPAVLLLVLSIAYAGEYHAPKEDTASSTETLVCSQCHTMHGSQGAGAGSASMIYSGAVATYARLLRAATAQQLCIYCHGSTSPGIVDGTRQPPMVVTTTNLGASSYIPSAGDFADKGFVNEANRHSIDLDLTTITPPGNTDAPGWGTVKTKFGALFNCLYCHDQHGNRNYRNLRYDPGNTANDSWASGQRVSYRMGGAGTCSDGNVAFCDVDNSTAGALSPANLNKYQRSNVSFYRITTVAGADYNRISAWCGKCHGSSANPGFFGVSGDTNMGGTALAGVGSGDTNTATSPWVRHPVGDVYIAPGTNLHADSTQLSAATTKTRYVEGPVAGIGGDEQPFCLSCHYAHGGGNPNNAGDPTLDHSNLVMFTDAGAINLQGAAGTYKVRNMCQQCHNQ